MSSIIRNVNKTEGSDRHEHFTMDNQSWHRVSNRCCRLPHDKSVGEQQGSSQNKKTRRYKQKMIQKY